MAKNVLKLGIDVKEWKRGIQTADQSLRVLTNRIVQGTGPFNALNIHLKKVQVSLTQLGKSAQIVNAAIGPSTSRINAYGQAFQRTTVQSTNATKAFVSHRAQIVQLTKATQIATRNEAMFGAMVDKTTASLSLSAAAGVKATMARAMAGAPMPMQGPQIPAIIHGARTGTGAVAGVGNAAVDASKKVGMLAAAGKQLKVAFGPLLAMVAGFAAVQFLAKTAAQGTELANRLRVVTEEGKDVAETISQVADISRRTRRNFHDTAVVFTRFSLATRRLGYDQKAAGQVVETLNKMMVVQGVSAHEARSAMLQLSQGLQSGRLAGDEFRAIQEILPMLLQDLSAAMGAPVEQLKALASQGKITPQIVMEALLQQTGKIDMLFKRTTMTMTQFGEMTKTIFQEMFAQISVGRGNAEALSVVFKVLLAVFQALANTISILVKLFMVFVNLAKVMFDFISENIPFVGGLAEQFFNLQEAFSGALDWVNNFLNPLQELTEAEKKNKEETEAIIKAMEEADKQAAASIAAWNELKTGIKLDELVVTFQNFNEAVGNLFMDTFVNKIPDAVGNSFADMIMEGKNVGESLKAAFKDMAKQIIASLIKMAVQMMIVRGLMMMLGIPSLATITAPGTTPGGGITDIIKRFNPFKKRQHGGPVSPNMPYLVGEAGPELFVPNRGGNIVANNQMQRPIVIQSLQMFPNASLDEALMNKPMQYWVDFTQDKILPALNNLGQAGSTTQLRFEEAR